MHLHDYTQTQKGVYDRVATRMTERMDTCVHADVRDPACACLLPSFNDEDSTTTTNNNNNNDNNNNDNDNECDNY